MCVFFFLIIVISVVTSPFSFLILFTWVLAFLLREHAQKFVNLFYSFKEPVLGFIDFFPIFKISISFISSLICSIYFFLLTFSFACSSFSNF